LSVCRFTDYDYTFGIVKLFLFFSTCNCIFVASILIYVLYSGFILIKVY